MVILTFLSETFSVLLRMFLQREVIFVLDFSKIGSTSEEDIFLQWLLQIILNPESEEIKTVYLCF